MPSTLEEEYKKKLVRIDMISMDLRSKCIETKQVSDKLQREIKDLEAFMRDMKNDLYKLYI